MAKIKIKSGSSAQSKLDEALERIKSNPVPAKKSFKKKGKK
jgi:hypothetical protein